MAAKRATQSIEQRQNENFQDKKRKAAKRAAQSGEEKSKEKYKDKIRIAAKRADQSLKERSIYNMKNKKNVTQKRHNAKSGVSPREAFKSNEIMDGGPIVLDIRDTKDDIGKMVTKCQDCHAYKFEKESPTTCCSCGMFPKTTSRN